MKKKLVAVVLFGIFALTMLVGCGGSKVRTLEEIKNSGKLYMVTEPGFAPMEYMQGQEIIGVDIDIANKIADELGVKLELVTSEFAAVLTSINSGKADMSIAGINITPEREEAAVFSVPYYESGQVILAKSDSGINTEADLKGKTLGAQVGTTGEAYILAATSDQNITPKHYQKFALAIKDLQNDTIDAIILDVIVAERFVLQHPELVISGEKFSPEPFAVALPLEVDPAFKEVVDKIVSEMVASGELDASFSAHMNNVVASGIGAEEEEE